MLGQPERLVDGEERLADDSEVADVALVPPPTYF